MNLGGKCTVSIISGSPYVRGLSMHVHRPTCHATGSTVKERASKSLQGADWGPSYKAGWAKTMKWLEKQRRETPWNDEVSDDVNPNHRAEVPSSFSAKINSFYLLLLHSSWGERQGESSLYFTSYFTGALCE